MKKILSLLIITLISIGLFSSCAMPKSKITESENKLNIVTTIFPQYDFARQVAGKHAEVNMLLKPGAESHSFEPTPQDIKKIQNADIFIYTGGENDTWVEDILSSMGDKKPETIKLLDCVPTVTEEIVDGMEHEHDEKGEDKHDHDSSHDEKDEDKHEHDSSHDEKDEDKHDHEEEIDEHVWTSPKNAILIVEKIEKVLSDKDKKNSKQYLDNSVAYINKLKTLDNKFKEIAKSGKRKTILFGDRFPFRYFADDYGLKYFAAFSGCSTESEASAATVAFLTNKVKEEQIPVVFTIEFSNGKIADSICDATGAKKLTLHSCHNVSADEFASGVSYFSIMEQNLEPLKEALN
ncbi:metal ABC transporter substrate-binding protein [Terrisporobacter glycolicus]|uniref:metal ABC transporter substrate-binding protein n=1 Tax=Terrisporobacter glycolicus TaxID=36841 RepID=UPI0003608DD7|nr:metal ABC transporter substrate-binding protein [Terrisporobacter glycolicus]